MTLAVAEANEAEAPSDAGLLSHVEFSGVELRSRMVMAPLHKIFLTRCTVARRSRNVRHGRP
ncbi:hypothetical protein ACV229_27045 [Burkholderia sp. MR1-5-21]